jgi:hypothetical protein
VDYCPDYLRKSVKKFSSERPVEDIAILPTSLIFKVSIGVQAKAFDKERRVDKQIIKIKVFLYMFDRCE